MIDKIFAHFGLDEKNIKTEPIGSGLINETWRVRGSNLDLILQKINHAIFKNPEAITDNIHHISSYLKEHYPDYLFPKTLPGKNNQELVKLEKDGSYYRMTHFVKNSHTIDTVQNPKQAYEAARQFGRFTHLLSDFPLQKLKVTLPDFHNLTLRYEQFKEALYNGDLQRIEDSAELIKFINSQKNIVSKYEEILKSPDFKVRVTHHDTKISNVLFDSDENGLCVIDLDTVMPGYFISDVGDMLRTYLSPVSEEEKDFSKIEIRDEYFHAIKKGYLEEMQDELSDEEKKHFIFAGKFMIYMQAIRFLTDHLNNDTYYGAKYIGHNFVRAGNQVVLLKRLLEKEERLS
ncbi:MAG: aminoglycoside phosphotransferase family protein [Ginsengibacter sp.]